MYNLKKNGFVFIETIITVVILASSLLYLYNSYSSIISSEESRLYYDDTAYIYKANYVRKFLVENSNIDKIKNWAFDNTYIVTIGTGFEGMFSEEQLANKMDVSLSNIVDNFKINRILLVNSQIFKDCFSDEEGICKNSFENVNYNLKEYIYTLNDTNSSYYLVFEFAEKYDSSNGLGKCTSESDESCKTYYVSLNLGEKYLSDYIINTYKGDGSKGLYLHNEKLENGANDNNYRFSGANPNNYVCFGSEDETCPDDNLYRIIGVFDNQVKLIKSDVASKDLLGENGNYYGIYVWNLNNYNGQKKNTDLDCYYWIKQNADNANTNSWLKSDLNKINLNTNYLNNIGEKWSNKIANHIWNAGGINNEVFLNKDYILSPPYFKEYYDLESGINGTGKDVTYNAKIGLMYVSDYLYGSDLDKSFYNNNWIFLGIGEHTISKHSNDNVGVYVIESYGEIGYEQSMENKYIIRPTFYLKKSIKYVSGTGTKEDPIRID